MSVEGCPAGVHVNVDISGPGVRASLYLQSILTVILVRVSPEDAPGAYWSMTATALGLIISSLVTALLRDISLLDAIVVTYVLILPIVASAFGVAHLTSKQPSGFGPTTLRRAQSPLIILANWLRSALTYAFALFVWAKAPNFGSGPPECDQATRFIFFGASLPALGSGRILNLVGWGILTLLFVWRTYQGKWTLGAAVQGLFLEDVMIKPKEPPKNDVNMEKYAKYTYHTGEHEYRERAYRPGQVFHEMLQGMMNQILGLASYRGQGRWYRKYGQLILATLISAWAIAMTELELSRNRLEEDIDRQWGFGQILPLLLTISPLFSLWEAMLKKRARGPVEKSKRKLRLCMVGATGLKRGRTEIDQYGPEELQAFAKQGIMTEQDIEVIRRPSPFAVLTIDGTHIYNTFYEEHAGDPEWMETFDAVVSDTSTIVVRIFDMKAMSRGWPALIGYTTIAPFSILPPGQKGPNPPPDSIPVDTQTEGPTEESSSQAMVRAAEARRNTDGSSDFATVVREFPLVLDREVVPGTSVVFSVSADISGPPPLPKIPARYLGVRKTNVKTQVGFVKWRGRKVGRREVTVTETYRLGNDEG